MKLHDERVMNKSRHRQFVPTMKRESLNSEDVKALWKHMMARYGTRLVRKTSAFEIKCVAVFLSMMGVLNAEAFMARHALFINRRIYLPWEIGEDEDEEALWQQLVTCVRIHQHAVQLHRHGHVLFTLRYLSNNSRRVRYEVEALRCEMELHWWRRSEALNPSALAKKIKIYGCRPSDVSKAVRLLEASAEAVQEGQIANQATNEALVWLHHHAPQVFNGGSG